MIDFYVHRLKNQPVVINRIKLSFSKVWRSLVIRLPIINVVGDQIVVTYISIYLKLNITSSEKLVGVKRPTTNLEI